MRACATNKISGKLLAVNYYSGNVSRMLGTAINPNDYNMISALRLLIGSVIATLSLLFGTALSAQTQTFDNTTSGTINGATTCANPLTRTFTVSNSFVLADVDIGMRGSHTWRGDVRATLRHPDGTSVQVVDGNSNDVSGDNFNFRLNDEGTQLVNTDGNTVNHTTNAVNGGYQHNFIPNSALSAFDGKTSNGTWTLSICDIFTAQDNGTFLAATLYLSPPSADLSLNKTVSNNAPTAGQQVTYTLVATNSSASGVTAAVTVRDALPAGTSFVSQSGYGTYNSSTGIWTIASIAPGQSRTINIVVDVAASAGAVISNTAEIQTSTQFDPDSTPGNSAAGEDDISTATFTVQGARVAGIPPALSCPKGSLAFNWAGRTWTPGSTANNYNLAGFGAFNWLLQSPAPYLDVPQYGGIHPRLTDVPQNTLGLSIAIDFANRSQIATNTITLGEVVDGSQFTIFDIDSSATFADFVRVTGRLGTTTVTPVLTNGIANYVIGNAAYGDQTSSDAQPNGNVVVTFNSAIDSIVIEYGSHALAPADPSGQAIQIPGNIRICTPNADLVVAKSSTPVSDPVSGETNSAFAIPEGIMRYCILISNTGSATARDVVADDVLPTTLTYNPGTLQSGTTCENATTAEDDNATGPDETDAIGASFDAGAVAIRVPAMISEQTAAVTFEATIN